MKLYRCYEHTRYPVAESIARNGLYLPSGLTLMEEQITQVSDVLSKLLNIKTRQVK